MNEDYYALPKVPRTWKDPVPVTQASAPAAPRVALEATEATATGVETTRAAAP